MAFGCGLEIALACHARISTSTAQLGLQYGILPGFGGTQRLPRLVGLAKSLEMILMSKRVNGEEARRLSLVDAIAPAGELIAVARQWALGIFEQRKPWVISLYKTEKLEPLDDAKEILKSARLRVETETPKLVCIDIIEAGIVSNPHDALWKEAEAQEKLQQSSTFRTSISKYHAPDLAEDLLIEIFQKLPTKSVLRFRTIAKAFDGLLTSPAFKSAYLHCESESKEGLLLVRHSTESDCCILSLHDSGSANLDSDTEPMQIPTHPCNPDMLCSHNSCYLRTFNGLRSTNGLVLLVDHQNISVCNPGLRQTKIIEVCPFSDDIGYYGSDPHASRLVVSSWGFGNNNDPDYFIVHLQILMVQNYYNFRAHLFESTTDTWREIDDKGVIFGFAKSHHFFSDVCHWNTKALIHHQRNAILTFKLEGEVFGKMEYPIGLSSLAPSLLTLKGCLAVACGQQGYRVSRQYDIWVMKEYGTPESWTMVRVVGPFDEIRPLFFGKHGMLVETETGELAWCSMHSSSSELRRLPIQGIKGTSTMSTYHRSLFSIR